MRWSAPPPDTGGDDLAVPRRWCPRRDPASPRGTSQALGDVYVAPPARPPRVGVGAGEPHVEQCVPAEIVPQVVQRPEEFAVRPREDFPPPSGSGSFPPARRPTSMEPRPGLAHREVVGRGGSKARGGRAGPPLPGLRPAQRRSASRRCAPLSCTQDRHTGRRAVSVAPRPTAPRRRAGRLRGCPRPPDRQRPPGSSASHQWVGPTTSCRSISNPVRSRILRHRARAPEASVTASPVPWRSRPPPPAHRGAACPRGVLPGPRPPQAGPLGNPGCRG